MKTPCTILPLMVGFLLMNLNGQSQSGTLQITTRENSDHTVDINYEKSVIGSIYVDLVFTRLENTKSTSSFYRGTISSPSGKLVTLKPVNVNMPVNCSLRYTWIRGKLVSKPDTAFLYLLPVSHGKTVKVSENTYLHKAYFGKAEPKNWKSFQFNVEAGDTVFSARKGVVIEITDQYNPGEMGPVSYSSQANSLLIEHEDGTIAYYSVLKKGSFLVKPGQTVYPHTPLALAGTFDTGENTQFRLAIFYLIEDKIDHSGQKATYERKNYYAFIHPFFHTKEGDSRLEAFRNYTSDITHECVVKEMTKREKKKSEQ